jgi:hypothetical protein
MIFRRMAVNAKAPAGGKSLSRRGIVETGTE